MATALTLDAGALIALDRGTRDSALLLQRVRRAGAPISVPAGVVAPVWRDGRLQVRLARLLADADVELVPLDDQAARAAGVLCGVTRTSDVIDASVVLCARSRDAAIATTDPGDLRRLDPGVELYEL
jgi:hypothetical protein